MTGVRVMWRIPPIERTVEAALAPRVSTAHVDVYAGGIRPDLRLAGGDELAANG
ncbi:MAG TPA: hypothetical protein VMQ65_03780 [Candidatus Limnocylindria bacterium]|nr:hypothetical protein [Candidatus Limnocylindria bacterium]